MYLYHYGIYKKPFQISVDPSFLWMSEKHKEALAMLRYGILDNRGFIALTGDVGTGKTTLINALISSLESDVLVANITNPSLKRTEFFNHLATMYRLGKTFSDKSNFLFAFQSFLEKTYREGRQVLLIIDEAQRLTRDMLEEIRLLSNIELQNVKLLNVFFVGQDEFSEMLNRDEHRALRQRMTIQFHLEPLSKDETSEYILHRLEVSGTKNEIFTQSAIQEIHTFSEGYPRVINIICDHAMLTGYVKKLKKIDAPEILECASELRLRKKSRSDSLHKESIPLSFNKASDSESSNEERMYTKSWVEKDPPFHVNIFYNIKPLIPRRAQIFLRQKVSRSKKNRYRHQWPINELLGDAPEKWSGWPENKNFALVLRHDVDTQKGYDSIPLLIDIEKQYGLKSSFNIVPERYKVHPEILDYIREHGFEINVHGLKHDGKLFKNIKTFNKSAVKINGYLEQWDAKGFTAPSMICNLEWLHELKIDHSTGTVDTDPFEPNPTPSNTIFPFIVNHHPEGKFFIELPLTMPQDHTLFIILKEKNISIWKEKLQWISKKGGMALINTHPDYMLFSDKKCGNEEYPVSLYTDFLEHVLSDYKGLFWNTQPDELAQFWKRQFNPLRTGQ